MRAPVLRSIADLRAALAPWRRAGESIGLVPTMGALHEGHLSLVRLAKAECRRAVATIFVNPSQFGANEDLSAYPRGEAADRKLLDGVEADLLFVPSVEEIYPPGFATTVSVARLTEHLCGPHRPGHFAGVATVVTKLLVQALPDRAYFGEKDFQQLQVIRRLARDLDLPVTIRGGATTRDADGLALSSRNRYLTADERAKAAALPRLLREAAKRLADGGDAEVTLNEVRQDLAKAGFARIDYVTLADEAELQPLARAEAGSRVFAAAWLGRTRLIDNWPVM
ncbi:MAG TPA: pantoate--beta-alanine ligase [Candidatus Udaeobacter sp.]|nr:pantoate--beta-alanine ligase [Candidatus Udaeobacter sp.]